jgi:hypothetical protein
VKETIYLRVSPQRVEGMTKSLPSLNRGEIPVKLVVEVDPSAFREPVLERHVQVTDWREGIDIADIDLRESVITEAEAQMIRDRRLAQMRKILEEHGYEVTAAEPQEGNAGG